MKSKVELTPEERLNHLRYMLAHILYVGNEDDVTDGELIAMVRHQRDMKAHQEARVRHLKHLLRNNKK